MDRGPVFAGNYRRSADDVKHKTTRLMFVCGHWRRPVRIPESIPKRSRRPQSDFLTALAKELAEQSGKSSVSVRAKNLGQSPLGKPEN